VCRSGAYAEAWGQRNAEKDRCNNNLLICVFIKEQCEDT